MIPRNLCLDTGKIKHGSRLEAENALAVARMQWRRQPARAKQAPDRIYFCSRCDGWHLTHAQKA